MACPNCDFKVDPFTEPECPACGLIFEKGRKAHTPPAPPEPEAPAPPQAAPPEADADFIADRVHHAMGRLSWEEVVGKARELHGMAGSASRTVRTAVKTALAWSSGQWRKWLKTQADNPAEERLVTWAVLFVLAGLLVFLIGGWMALHSSVIVPSDVPVPPAPSPP